MQQTKLTVLFLALGIFISTRGSGQPADFVKKVDALLNEAIGKNLFSGIVYIVDKDGKPSYQKIHGYADWNKKTPIAENTVFNIGSLTKSFTAEMIRQLEKEGKLKTTDLLLKYLDLFPEGPASKITIQQLLEMRSGLGDYLNTPQASRRILNPGTFTMQEKLQIIKEQPLLFEPGAGQQYSNSGFVVLGAVIEKITGKSYSENLKERILIPFGMTQTFHAAEDVAGYPSIAYGSTPSLDGSTMKTEDYRVGGSPEGATRSSIKDMAKWGIVLASGNLPSGFKRPPIPLFGGNQFNNSAVIPRKDGGAIVILANVGEIADELAPRIIDIAQGKEHKSLEARVDQKMYQYFKQKGWSYVKEHLPELARQADAAVRPPFLIYMGYRFLNQGEKEYAIELFRYTTELFPQNANGWDSLGEAYLSKGDKQNALKYYKKALEVDPGFENAKQMIKKIEGS